jgi:hypothetical protein
MQESIEALREKVIFIMIIIFIGFIKGSSDSREKLKKR